MTEYIEESFITEDEGIQKKMISAGGVAKPEQGDEIEVTYQGRLEDGTIFDDSGDIPRKFRIGEGAEIQGLQKGIAAMNIGEKADLIIKPEYAYGKDGLQPMIPEDATLTFTIELLSIMADDREK